MVITITLLALALLAIAFACIGGAAFMLAFGDVIVFGLIIYMIVKLVKNKKKGGA